MNRIGRYEVEGRIGSGGFATVYLVRDTTLDSKVAAKVLAENWTDSTDLRERFIREAQILRRIDSNRVVTVHDIGELDSGQPYFVMSLATAGTLEDRITVPDVAPTPEDVQQLSREVAECIKAVHSHDLIHRDIKPSNLLITGGAGGPYRAGTPLIRPAERLLLGDFGLAKDTALQATGMTIAAGTGGYAAPEQMTPTGNPTRQTDLYAATAVLYRVISGTNPPNYDLVGEQVPFPEHGWWMKGRLGQFFRRGMAFQQGARHESIDAWLAEFGQAYGGGQRTVLPTVAAPGTPSSDPGSAVATPNPTPITPQPHVQAPSPSSAPVQPTPVTPPPATAPISAVQDPTSVLPQYQNPQTGAPQHGHPGQQGPVGYGQPGHPGHQTYGQPGTQQGYSVGSGEWPAGGGGQPQHYGGATSPHTGHPGYAQGGGAPAPARRRPWLTWLVATVILAGLAAAGAFIGVTLLDRPTIDGPGQIVAGTSQTYRASFDGADDFRWTFNGRTTDGAELSVSGIVPGPITIEVEAISNGQRSRSATMRIEVLASPLAPTIVGPSEVRVGDDPAVYTFEGPDGATNPIWIEGATRTPADSIRITADAAGAYDLVLVVTLQDGVTQVGTRRTIQLVN